MSSYYHREEYVEYPDKGNSALLFDSTNSSTTSPDLLLSQEAEQHCKIEGIDYKRLEPIQRLFLTHYRCPMCKLLPLYYLNLTRPKRARCGRCGNLISFTNSGKYGRLRKKIAFTLHVRVEGRKNIGVF